jgi:paraquat-inducible protein A
MRGHRADPTSLALSCTVTALVFYLIVLSMPLMTLDLLGRLHTVNVLTGPVALFNAPGALAFVGAVVLLATVLMPGLVIVLNLVVLSASRRSPSPAYLNRLLRLQKRLRPWSMVEVYMLGIFVAYTKLVDLAHVDLDASTFALAAIMVLMITADGAFDRAAIWDKIHAERGDGLPTDGDAEEALADTSRLIACHDCELVLRVAPGRPDPHHCPRCDAVLHRREPQSLQRTMAYLIASAILYVPANLLPVLTLTKLGRGEPSTILAGVVELYDSNMLPLALLVFFASVCVPCLKVVGLLVMVVMTHFRLGAGLFDRTRLFRIIDFIGRWSMIDVFMISILVAIVHFGFLANVDADPGIVAFAGVVILTIFAAESFDPRLMWDAAEAPRRRRAGARSQTPALASGSPAR